MSEMIYRGVRHQPEKNLNEVFGITSSIPKYTYVDRAQLDNKFKYFLTNEKHIVIHGASKQGKTVLRKKHLEQNSIVVQCSSMSTIENIYIEILQKLNTQIVQNYSESKTIEAQGKIPLIKGDYKNNQTTSYSSVGNNLVGNNLSFISEQIKNKKIRVIIEDFHYLPEIEKKRLAFDLKVFWDNSVFFIIVGVWAEDNLLLYYNGDLSGRLNEIDVQWTNEELEQVLSCGEKALNIKFSTQLRKFLIRDSNQNVGLLQRIAEKMCLASGVFKYQTRPNTISNENAYANCRKSICDEASARYRQFSEVVSRGFVNGKTSPIYQYIIHVCLEFCSDEQLCQGIHQNIIFDVIKENITSEIIKRNLSNALCKINQLQIDENISPLVFSYNPDLRIVQLVDRELLFYKKWGNPKWCWSE